MGGCEGTVVEWWLPQNTRNSRNKSFPSSVLSTKIPPFTTLVQQTGPYNVKLVTLQITYLIYIKLHVQNTPWIVSLVLQSVSAGCFVPQVNCFVKDYL